MQILTAHRARTTLTALEAKLAAQPISAIESDHKLLLTSVRKALESLEGVEGSTDVAYRYVPVGLTFKTIYNLQSMAQRRLAADGHFCYHARSR